MKDYLRLLRFLKNHRKLFSMAVGTMFIASFFEVFQLSLLVPMTDRIFNNKQIIVPNELPQFMKNIVAHFNGMDPQVLFPMFIISFICVILLKNF